MISVSECVNRLVENALSNSQNLNIQETPIMDAAGTILAEDIHSTIDVPSNDNSAMDGYVFRHEDTINGSALPISQRIQAGDSPSVLKAGTAARIFTGAEIPDGADTVEMQENCSVSNKTLSLLQTIQPGKNIRRRGQDIGKNDLILAKGSVLRPQDLGLLASIGVNKVSTYTPLKIAILNTGNELVEPGQPLAPGKIYNSNRFLLDAILKGWGFDVGHSDIAVDDLKTTKMALQKLSKTADILISTGGVSVGEEDHIKPAVESLGELDIWKVAIKPGKPFAFGHVERKPFIGLPGNPASVFVTLLVLARPYLLALQGVDKDKIHTTTFEASANFSRKPGKREEYLRAKLCKDGVDIHPNQSSGVLSSASWGDCLVIQGLEKAINEGDQVKLLPYTSLFSL